MPQSSVPVVDDWRFDTEDALDGWRVGILTASYLRFYFPDFWAAHVAQKPITTSRLLGAFHAFVELGHRNLLELDLGFHCPLDLGTTEPDDVPDLVDGYRDHGGILWELAGELRGLISMPPVQTFGLDRDEVGTAWGQGGHRLALALTWMLRETAWQTVGLGPSAVGSCPGGAAILALPTLYQRTAMDAAIDALEWSCPLAGISEPWRLGDVLRYVCGQTHNEFADYSPAEANQEMADWCMGIYGEPERLAYEIRRQRGAKTLAAVYTALDARVTAEPALLAELAAALVDAAYGATAMADRPLYQRLAEEVGVWAA